MKFPRATGLRGVPALMVLAMARLVERKPAAQYAVAAKVTIGLEVYSGRERC